MLKPDYTIPITIRVSEFRSSYTFNYSLDFYHSDFNLGYAKKRVDATMFVATIKSVFALDLYRVIK